MAGYMSDGGFIVYPLSTPEEQEQGALAFASPLPVSTLLFFTRVPEGIYVHMRGMTESLRVIFLDLYLNKIQSRLLQPGEILSLPERTRHVVEISAQAQELRAYKFLERYL